MGVFFIAEIGINHNGSLEIAKKLIDWAKGCGCDAVKFQKRTIDLVYSQEELDKYRESPWGTTNRQQKEGLEFGKEEYDEIDAYCLEKDIEWFASAWDLESQKFLQQYNLKHNKIAAAMLTNMPLLEMVAEEGKPTFLSTGMSTYAEIDAAIEVFQKHNCPYILMHCNSAYPTPRDQINLRMIQTLRDRYHCDVGYSGHETGRTASYVAAVLGACAIERHITLDRAMYGSDQAASLQVQELERLMIDIRNLDTIMGDGIKRISDEEEKVKKKLRKQV